MLNRLFTWVLLAEAIWFTMQIAVDPSSKLQSAALAFGCLTAIAVQAEGG